MDKVKQVAGEALFNDGTALVLFQLFTDVLQTAAGSVSISHFMLTFARMAAGGVGVGFMSGLAGAVALGYTESGTLVRSRLWKVEGWVWKAATSKADPGQQQDWILKCLQDGRAHLLAACAVATLCCLPSLKIETVCNDSHLLPGGLAPLVTFTCSEPPLNTRWGVQETVITLAVAYLGFFVADSVLDVSGVLATVAAGLTLALLGRSSIRGGAAVHQVG